MEEVQAFLNLASRLILVLGNLFGAGFALVRYSEQAVLADKLEVNVHLGSAETFCVSFILSLVIGLVANLNDVFNTHVLEDALLVEHLFAVDRAALDGALLVFNQTLAQEAGHTELGQHHFVSVFNKVLLGLQLPNELFFLLGQLVVFLVDLLLGV